MILKLVLRFVQNFSSGCIQTGHTNFFPTQVCGRFWWGWRLSVHTCLHEMIALINLNILQVICSSLILLIVSLCVSHLSDQCSLILNLVLACVSNFQLDVSEPGIRTPPPPCRFLEGRGEGAGFCDFTCRHQYID